MSMLNARCLPVHLADHIFGTRPSEDLGDRARPPPKGIG